jgi:DNA-binding CsgD family transcriptional regulator
MNYTDELLKHRSRRLQEYATIKKILEVFMGNYEKNQDIERIVHLAKNANEYDTVVQYAPLAARQAASVGAHIEASKLYLTAIEYYQGNDRAMLIQFYEAYAYECYLTNQVKEAIIYTAKSLNFLEEKNDKEKIGNSLRFLSRLWWFDGNRKNAERFAGEAIEVLDSQPSSSAKAMAYSNMSQLKLLSDQTDECISWGKKAIAIARQMNDEETVAHALNSMGSALMTIQLSMPKGIELLQQSLTIALKNSYHEHVARAYTALGSNAVTMKDYLFARNALDEGIHYCEEKDLGSLKLYMLSWKARLNLETGNWNEAYRIAGNLIKNEDQAPVVKIGALAVVATIKIRRGDTEALPLLLKAKTMAFETMELQRIIPVLSALLEYEWITGKRYIEKEVLDQTINMIGQIEKISKKNKLYYWLRKARKEYLPLKERYEGYEVSSVTTALKEAALWRQLGCPYEQALFLFEGTDDDKRKAIKIFHDLGATAVYEKMKLEMRTSGIKSIPRGVNKTTQANTAFLTFRELDILPLLKEGLQNKEIAARLFISAKTVDHHISSILFKLNVHSRVKAVTEAVRQKIIN